MATQASAPRSPRVRLTRQHVRAGLWMGLTVAVVLYIGDLVQNGFSVLGLVLFSAAAVVLIAAQIWVYWHADNRLGRDLRASRFRRRRGPAKVR